MAIQIQNGIPLAPITTFKIGGNAKYFVTIRDQAELTDALAWARKSEVPFAILSGGSNVLISDNGFDGLVIHIESSKFDFVGSALTAEAGCNLLSLIHAAAEKGLGGWESLAGIPGTIGGAARGNAGAFGSEIKDFATTVRALHSTNGEIREFSNSECDFSYRHSYFKDHPEWIITRVSLELREVDPIESARAVQETIVEREKRHLQNVMAAGSYFMNPIAPDAIVRMFESEKNVKSRERRVPAGWLIEKAGMKGAVVGGAMASMQHPNYIVNTGTATSHDVRKLAMEIKVAVHEKFGVTLTEEAAIF